MTWIPKHGYTTQWSFIKVVTWISRHGYTTQWSFLKVGRSKDINNLRLFLLVADKEDDGNDDGQNQDTDDDYHNYK